MNWQVFEQLCAMHCTLAEIAAALDCSEDTVERGCKRHYKKLFAEVWREKSSKGKASLRSKMWNKALVKDDTKMQIYLSKQYLGMSDKITHTQEEENKNGEIVYDTQFGNDK